MGLGKTVEVLALIMAHKWPGRKRDGASSRENRTPLSSPLDLSSLGSVTNQDLDIELSSPLNLGSVTNQDVDVELTSDIELSSPLNLGSVTNQDVDVELTSDIELSSPLNLGSERSVIIHDIDTSDIELSSPLTYMYGEVNSSASPLSSSLDLSSPLCVDDVQGDGVSEDILPVETGLNSLRDVKEQQQESSSAKTANEEAATQPIALTYTTSELQTSTLQGTPLGEQMDCFKGRPNEATSVGVDNGPASDNLVSVAPPQTIMTATLATQTIFPQASILATPPRTRKAISSSLLIEDVVYREDSVRCLCGATREGNCEEEFVQCERCLVWQHSSCAGYDGSKQDTFVCVKCLLDKVGGPYCCKCTITHSKALLIKIDISGYLPYSPSLRIYCAPLVVLAIIYLPPYPLPSGRYPAISLPSPSPPLCSLSCHLPPQPLPTPLFIVMPSPSPAPPLPSVHYHAISLHSPSPPGPLSSSPRSP